MSLLRSIAMPNGFIDDVSIVAGRLLRVSGWSLDDQPGSIQVFAQGDALEPSAFYRTPRADAAAATGSHNQFLGFTIEYVLPTGTDVHVELTHAGDAIYGFSGTVTSPPYERLLFAKAVFDRERIYRAGPPTAIATPEIVALAAELPEPILDFGCGGCGPLRALLSLGLDAHGIEVTGTRAAKAMPDDLRSHVTLYDGAFPMPFTNGSFKSVLATEVIEHIADYESAIADIARVASEQAVFTVPDNSVIPLCSDKGLIPWHYLSADHYNFFTQQSLTLSLQPYFGTIEVIRLQRFEVGGVEMYANLAARCQKRSP